MITAIIVISILLALVYVACVSLYKESSRNKRFGNTEHLDKVKEQKQQRNQNRAPRNTQNKNTNKTKANKAKVKIDTATLLAGAALAHQMRKHHKQNDTKDITDDRLYTWDDGMDELYDDELYDDYDYDDNADYDYERAAYEEQAAYDDYIASLDMADD